MIWLGSLSVEANTQVFAWGDNSAGQCQIPNGLTNAQAIAGGYRHSIALRSDGTVTAWGFDNFGQTNVPPNLTSVMAVAGGVNYSMALQSNGTVVTWGNSPAAPSGLGSVRAIAAGWFHCLALESNGTVVAWGDNSAGETNVPPGLTNVMAIAAGSNLSLALQSNGLVAAWGDNSYGQAFVPAQLTNVAAIAAGQTHCLALNHDGSVVAWGGNFDGQATVPAGLTNAVAISAGALHSFALKSDGSLTAWGDNTYHQTNVTSALSSFFAITTGGYHDLAIQGNGAPIIFVPPQSQTVLLTKSATLTALATGAQPLSYQWQKNGTNIAGATNSSLFFASASLLDAAAYDVIVSNNVSAVTSSSAILNVVGQPPFITLQPQPQTTICGDTATFQSAADGTPPLGYQWLFQGTAIAGATSTNLVLNDVLTNQAGFYAMVATNQYGSITSAPAQLTVIVQPPLINSPLSANAVQGQPFNYNITALYSPISFAALGLPPGLTIDTASGIISGTPTESGTFGPVITALNACSSDSETLLLSIGSGIPVITSPLTVNGTEEAAFAYQIAASQSPGGFGAQNLPVGLSVDPNTGIISGTPTYAGIFYPTITASNIWGTGAATLQMSFTNEQLSGLSIGNVTYSYASPYLLNFQFSLIDNNDPTMGNAVVVDPSLLSATCFENTQPIIASDTGIILRKGNTLPLKAFLVLDFADSIASLSNGDTNNNGISDAVDLEVGGSEAFVSQQPPASQIGVFEFHRDDVAPLEVVPLTNNAAVLENAIAGIWTNDVQGFSSGSRTWDAVSSAITALGPANTNEQHYVILASDGVDESSTATLDAVILAATNANVQVYCLGFGDELDSTTLMQLASGTSGRYFGATNLSDMAADFDLISKDLNGQYILRWATLKRSSIPFSPSFLISYQGLVANSPSNVVFVNTNGSPIINTNTSPPTTNYPFGTNDIIGDYVPSQYAGGVTTGLLSLASSPNGQPTELVLSAYYVPRNITQMHLHYRANWPCTISLLSTNPGEMLYGWSLAQTSDGTNGTWLSLASPPPQSVTNSIAFASFGDILAFQFEDVLLTTSNALSLLAVDNSIYTNTGGQSFIITNLASSVTNYPVLPFGTPIPWLMYYGYTGNFTNAELSDTDHDGMAAWQEYQANTIPTNAASKFAITSIARASDGLRYQISFSTSSDRTYRLQSSTDLVNWQTVQDNIPGIGTPATNVDVTITDATYYYGASQVYYRAAVY